MKRAFNIIGVAVAALVMEGCIDLEPPPTASGSEGGTQDAGDADGTEDETGSTCGVGCDEPHELRGELMLLVNGRLSSAEALYQSNVPLDEAGTYLGPSLHLYDPTRSCDDGTNACRLASLGNLRLDEGLGAISVQDGSLQKFTLRDLAWSPAAGLWAVSFDVKNDEWGVAQLQVDDWTRAGQIGIDRYAIVPGDALSPSTDPCYWQEGVSGLAFLGDELLLGVRGVGGSGIEANGAVFRVDLEVIAQGHCVYPNDVSQDPSYYACDVLCEPWSRFVPQLGIAGDMAPDAQAADLLGVVRSENAEIMPLERQVLYRMSAPADGEEYSEPVAEGIVAEGIVPGLDIEGLARIGGRLYGVDVLGKVYLFDEEGRRVTEHDDLGPLFPDHELSLRIRGATRVVVDEG
ncbi:MAG: hypothetical protein H6712_00385 [Myxococcales bacterium]|nr:hypothetical protein [Myxococcales bacterium]